MNRSSLALSHNKTLVAQLYQEFKGFLPDNAVDYFFSYYDFCQPEAYVPATETYIERESLPEANQLGTTMVRREVKVSRRPVRLAYSVVCRISSPVASLAPTGTLTLCYGIRGTE